MSAADFDRVANKLRKVLNDKRQKMQRVVLAGEAIAKREAPVKTGHLRRTITSRVERGGDRGVIGTNAPHARSVHEGSRPHTIRPRRAKALKTPYGIFKKVKHPGTRANPFLTRTAKKLQRVAAQEFGRNIFAGVK